MGVSIFLDFFKLAMAFSLPSKSFFYSAKSTSHDMIHQPILVTSSIQFMISPKKIPTKTFQNFIHMTKTVAQWARKLKKAQAQKIREVK